MIYPKEILLTFFPFRVSRYQTFTRSIFSITIEKENTDKYLIYLFKSCFVGRAACFMI